MSLLADDQKELTAARAQLMATMSDTMKKEAPQELARAQLLFDCWQHEINKRINEELAPCEEEFKSTMTELDSFAYTEETDHTLTFAKKNARLTPKDYAMIKDIGRQVKHISRYIIEITALDAMSNVPSLTSFVRTSLCSS